MTQDLTDLLRFLDETARLQSIPRTGYLNAGIPNPESVAEHTHGVIWWALVIAFEESAELDRVLKLALLHDLPEARIGDLPSPMVAHYLGDARKQAMEQHALQDQLRGLPPALASLLKSWYPEHPDQDASLENRVVADADRLQMFQRIRDYQRVYQVSFEDFWQDGETRDWLPTSRRFFQLLKKQERA